MTQEELFKKIQDIEWEDFEVKEAANELPKNIWSMVSAFSNTAGGWIVLGVKQLNGGFQLTGVQNPEKIEQDFTTALRSEKFNITVSCTSRKYSFDNRTIILFYIPVSDKKPVYFGSPFNTYIRSASGDQRATKEEVDAMYRDQAFGTQTDRIIPDSDISWLDNNSFMQYRQFIQRNNPGHSYNRLSDREFLTRLRV